MNLSGLHLLLTYQCTSECDHCFVWGSPRQVGTMTLSEIRQILEQARGLVTVEQIYFEGGEPFLYYPILAQGISEAAKRGFQVGVVTNGYWATEVEDALAWLRALVGHLQNLSVSGDLYHGDEILSRRVQHVREAAQRLDIGVGTISVAQPDERDASLAPLMFRGRAAQKLAASAPHHRWLAFSECPYENLGDPARVHVDPLGYVHLCQGIAIGNLNRTPLVELCATYDPDGHPIIGPLLDGGPAELVRRYGLAHEDAYADACHLCYEARLALRRRFPDSLAPDQMYGLPET